ncbi:ankyrin repeat domain-containing protein [Jiulongibacter sediminis]|jgi:ankyrin repeat protein|uniref:ankyrin repeat domain-containing protein n=1 Tax=Jiulongibacter sediminis TaxID=1605367 RepID=UPI0026F28FB6|nr:ankyrin repeat domain-containing protein [Jiulongibacter sediminis]
METKFKDLLTSRDEEKLIELIAEYPSVLDLKQEGGSSNFATLAYHGLQKAFDFAITQKQSFDFYEAIMAGKKELCDAILKKKKSLLNSFAPDGFTPIALATYFNQDKIAHWLLSQGANPGIPARNNAKVNALHAAVARNNVGLAESFLFAGVDVDSPQMQEVTALHSAAHRGSVEMVKLLLRFHADKSLKVESGETALQMAQKDGHEEVVKLLSYE